MSGLRVGLVRDHRLARPLHHRPRLADPVAGLGQFLGQPVQDLRPALAVEQFEGRLVGDQEVVLAEGPRIAVDVVFANVLHAPGIVRAQPRIDQGDLAVVLAHAVAGRPRYDQLGTVRHRLGGQDCAVVDLVAVQHHLPGAVGVHRPQVMVAHVKAVHVFPAHVGDLAVGQYPGRVVVLDIGGQRAEIAPIGGALVQCADLGHPALHVAVGSCRAEDDLVVRQVGGLEIIPARRRVGLVILHAGRDILAVAGQLLQAGPVQVDFVQAVMPFPAGQIRKDEFPGVVVDLGIADVPLGVREDGADLPGLDVVDAQLSAGVHRERGLALVGRVVRDIGVPVPVDTGFAHGEQHLVRHPSVQELAPQRRPGVLGSGSRLRCLAEGRRGEAQQQDE